MADASSFLSNVGLAMRRHKYDKEVNCFEIGNAILTDEFRFLSKRCIFICSYVIHPHSLLE